MNSREKILRTPLYDLHVELNGKMTPFSGYEMPVNYSRGIIKEHLHTRSHAGLFDVSHMGQVRLTGVNVARSLEYLVPVDIEALALNKQVYAVFSNETGGILDDLIITRWGEDEFFLVFNAACKKQDLAHLEKHLPAEVNIEFLHDRALVALQGPAAMDVMTQLAPAAKDLVFMTGCFTSIEGVECYVSRCGYTGEDGFEISLPAGQADRIARFILTFDEVEAIGLGARDSLRLEAGFCLYGHDMDVHTSLIEARLQWSISKSRRLGGDKQGGFLGADVIFDQMISLNCKLRVGLLASGKAPIREGTELVNDNSEKIGVVTSGGFGPSLNAPVAMGYVEREYALAGTELKALVRDKQLPVRVSDLPFTPHRYFRG